MANSKYVQAVNDAISADYAGWSPDDQVVYDGVMNGTILPDSPEAKAAWEWAQHNAVNHADGAGDKVAKDLEAKGVKGEDPPHYWSDP